MRSTLRSSNIWTAAVVVTLIATACGRHDDKNAMDTTTPAAATRDTTMGDTMVTGSLRKDTLVTDSTRGDTIRRDTTDTFPPLSKHKRRR